jgi:signal transduction histidine kinase
LALFLGITFLSLSTKRRLKQAAEARQKSEAEFAAMMKERSRIAREIHDTLAQGLSAISLHLELVRDHVAPASLGAQSLDEARSLVRSSMKEARNSIWKMRSHALETGNLATALQDVLNHLRGVESQLTVSGDLRRMPPIVENNLLRIGQEAITNAKKYSGATKIDVRIEVEKDKLHLHVCDNGRGFNVESTGNTDSQFGLVGLRERAKEINATLSIATSPGQGTDIAVTLRDPTADPSSLKEALS